jgi:hypothetical protein
MFFLPKLCLVVSNDWRKKVALGKFVDCLPSPTVIPRPGRIADMKCDFFDIVKPSIIILCIYVKKLFLNLYGPF